MPREKNSTGIWEEGAWLSPEFPQNLQAEQWVMSGDGLDWDARVGLRVLLHTNQLGSSADPPCPHPPALFTPGKGCGHLNKGILREKKVILNYFNYFSIGKGHISSPSLRFQALV